MAGQRQKEKTSQSVKGEGRAEEKQVPEPLPCPLPSSSSSSSLSSSSRFLGIIFRSFSPVVSSSEVTVRHKIKERDLHHLKTPHQLSHPHERHRVSHQGVSSDTLPSGDTRPAFFLRADKRALRALARCSSLGLCSPGTPGCGSGSSSLSSSSC